MQANKTTDANRAENEENQGQKLESLSVLAGGIAQDFNNLLIGILAHAGLARRALTEDNSPETARENIAQVETTALRAAELTKKLLAFSGWTQLRTERIDLASYLHDNSTRLRSQIPETARLELTLTAQLPLIEADPGQMRQLMTHLLTNAADALGGEPGRIDVGTGIVELDAVEIDDDFHPEKLSPGRYIYITVTDNGCGLDEVTLSQIFDPFFTTKSSGQGLGLAAVLGILQGHRGALQVRSSPGRGTTFKVYFPCAPSKEPQQVQRPPENVAVVNTAKILVVDDDEIVRRVTHKILETAGYGVATANDGLEAISEIQEHGDEIALILLDLRMPRLGGAEAFQEIRRIRPEIPIIVASGYDPSEGADGILNQLVTSFLPKPYSPQDLTARVAWLLEAARKDKKPG